MRSMLVAPGVPKGTPAVMMMRWPGAGEIVLEGQPAGAVDHLVLVACILADNAMRAPHQRQTARRGDDRGDRDDRRRGPLAGGPQAGGAGGRVADDGGQVQRFGDLAGRGRDRVGTRRFRLSALGVHDVGVVRVALDLFRHPVHRRDRLDREFARRRFGRQHDRIRPFEDSVGDVRYLCTGGNGRGDHRFQHLRRDHHRLAGAARGARDLLLDAGNLFQRHFHAEVAAPRPSARRKAR